MSDEPTPDLTALIERAYGCKPGAIHEGYGAECDSSAHAPALYRTFGCDHAAHLAEQITAAGFGPVRAVEAERAKWERLAMGTSMAHDTAEARAESAEAALAGLVAKVGALANEWASRPDDTDYCGDHARRLRALLPTPDCEEARDE